LGSNCCDQELLSARTIERQRGVARRRSSSANSGGLQELAETAYWLELLVETDIASAKRLEELSKEANELAAILITSAKKAKAREPSE
jgi:four helix bundle protein